MKFPYKHIFAKPKQRSDKAVILLPGISGKALSNRYKNLEVALRKSGFNFLRFDLWKSMKELETMTLKEIHQAIDTSIKFMHLNGCKRIGFIGKSFGGGVLLTHPHKDIKALVLLAPAIGFDKESNINKIKNQKFTKFKSIFDIAISKKELQKIEISTLIIQGTKDDVVPLKNSEKIVKNLPKGTLEKIEGAGHSFDKEGEMEIITSASIGFLRSFL